MKKNEIILKDCERFLSIFDHDGFFTEELDNITKQSNDSVSNFLKEQGKEKLHDSCRACWYKVTSVAFTAGFIMASMLDPNSKASLKGIQKLASKIKKTGILPIYDE